MVRARRLVLAAACLLAAHASSAAAAAPPVFGDQAGLHVVASKQLSPRLYDVTVSTAALPQAVHIRILVPAGYDPAAATRYPVLYLFHGTSGGAADWTTMGRAEETTVGRPLIVVMPDAGFDSDGGGYFADAFRGPAKWETFHIDQVIPWVDATLRTVAARRGRAIYGLSQGGYGAMVDAARHPDLFVAAGSFSGAVDIAADPDAAAIMTGIVTGTETGLNGDAPGTIFGPRATQEINWRGNDPATLASNLRGMDLRIYTGNGRPGPLDPPGSPPNPIEAGAHRLTELFHARLETLQLPSFYSDYGAGTHTWPYWARDLEDSIGPLMDVFSDPPATPDRVDFKTIRAHFGVFGWDVAIDRPAREFAALRGAGKDGFSLTGSGTATVLTPPVYPRRGLATVRLRGLHVDQTQTLRVRSDRRLRIPVPLGPGNKQQEDTLPAQLAGGTKRFTTSVRITARRVTAPAG